MQPDRGLCGSRKRPFDDGIMFLDGMVVKERVVDKKNAQQDRTAHGIFLRQKGRENVLFGRIGMQMASQRAERKEATDIPNGARCLRPIKNRNAKAGRSEEHLSSVNARTCCCICQKYRSYGFGDRFIGTE